MSTTRREALISIAAGAATAVPGDAQPKAAFFTAAELAAVTALADAIIPRTETPGASDAGVPGYIDRRLAATAKMAGTFREGLKLLQQESQRQFNKGFEALSAEQQIELLTPISGQPGSRLGAFFKQMKGLTIDGYYTSKEGLAKELGWHGNTFLPEFKGCTHREHQS